MLLSGMSPLSSSCRRRQAEDEGNRTAKPAEMLAGFHLALGAELDSERAFSVASFRGYSRLNRRL